MRKNFELNCPHEEQNETAKLDDLSNDIIKLQKECSQYVLEQTPEQIKKLLLAKNYFFVENDGEVVAFNV